MSNWLRTMTERSGRSTGGVRMSRATGIRRFVAIAATASLLLVGSVAVGPSQTATAAEKYPSWNDVKKARKSESSTKREIARIRNLIAVLGEQVAATQADAERKGELYQAADQAYQEAAVKADELQTQADAAHKLADQSVERAGEMASRLYRSGNNDFTMNLLVNSGDADDLLYNYGMANKFSEQAAGVYENAVQDRNTAQALTDQADVAKGLLKRLQQKAETALDEANAAAEQAAAALESQQVHKNQLNSQLSVLVGRRQATEKDYLKGVRARIKAAASLDAGQISNSGWVKPGGGYITSGFGYRVDPFGGGGSSYHLGTDLSAGCGAPIYAAHSGTVSYSGWNGVYGNFIRIDHGDGIQTEYGHIINGGLLVRSGQKVGVGQQIARVGMTGGATGCHLHFGVRRNGVVTDPVPFMRNRGINLG